MQLEKNQNIEDNWAMRPISSLSLLFFACLKICCSPFLANAQDERHWRDLLHRSKKVEKLPPSYQFEFSGNYYRYDLNSDGKLETFSWVRRDGVDFLDVEVPGKRVQSFRFMPVGHGARIHKIKIVNLDSDVRVALVYYFQGLTSGLQNEAEIRLYFMAWEKNDLSNLYWEKGPLIWMDQEQRKGFYWKRPMDVRVVDFNHDGTREIEVSHQKLSRVYFYKGQGRWGDLP